MYKAYIHDRNYTEWSFFDANTLNPVNNIDININPLDHKLFSNDIFSIDKKSDSGSGSRIVTVMHSSIRVGGAIPGVLVLKGNKTYGRQKTSKKNQKLLYKCVPDDRRIPAFLVPYEIASIGFSKVFTNLYVTFIFNEWNDKHPLGTLSTVIGGVDVIDNFYEYQLYCKSLNASIQKFTKDTSKALNMPLQKASNNIIHNSLIDTICEKHSGIIDRTDKNEWFVFTIDPAKSLDYDDAFSIKNLDDGLQLLSIYISNVTVCMDVLNLWDSFSSRISTIYLPDRKRPMLPTILSDCLCSLQQGTVRIAFVMDLFINKATLDIVDIKYSNCKVRVQKNFAYEEPLLLGNPHYQELLETTQKMSKKLKYINSLRNSHDVVQYLMILMNYNCAKEMLKEGNGIFRSTVMKREVDIPDTVPEDVGKYIKIWNSSCGQYIDGSNIGSQTTRHDLLEMDAYIHITSPIRRLVDLLNIMQFQKNIGIIKLSDKSVEFYSKWLKELDYINTTMRAIRKVQCDCSLLDLCSNDPATMQKIYDGYAFDKISRNDGLYQYIIFLPELKLTSRITARDNMENYDKRCYKLFLFNDEENFKKKIRLQIV